jgi:hypothetical protein
MYHIAVGDFGIAWEDTAGYIAGTPVVEAFAQATQDRHSPRFSCRRRQKRDGSAQQSAQAESLDPTSP